MSQIDGAASEKRYHHGDLPNALREAALELIGEVGPTGFSLREVARRAGVSHAAPAHHFGDKHGLVTALAIDGFELLAAAMTEAVEGHDDPIDRLIAQGQAYVRLARTNPSHFAVMWLPDVHHDEDNRLMDVGLRTFGCLVETIEEVKATHNPDLDVHAASMMCWALVQGLTELTDSMADLVDQDGYPIEGVRTDDDDRTVADIVRLAVFGMVHEVVPG